MTKSIIKIHVGLIIGFILTFISTFIIVEVSVNTGLGEITPFFPIALFFTYEYLIINFVKGDFLTNESKDRDRKEYNNYHYYGSNVYRIIIKVFMAICIIMAPIMWALTVIMPLK